MLYSRRALIRSAATLALAAPALKFLSGCATAGPGGVGPKASALELIPDPKGLLDLAPGLRYWVVSQTGDVMSDGLAEPGKHDGMATFPVAGEPDRCLIVRNHELGTDDGDAGIGAFGRDGAGASRIEPSLIYDRTPGGRPHSGGTTTLLVNTRTRRVERSHLSLAGTAVNCAGGPTPWGSWLSCEETELKAGDGGAKDHGFVFEVPAGATGLVQPLALVDMGRFRHEAAAVDPATGVVYLTEDTGDSLLYRFLPSASGELHKGGRLQALAILDQPGADTRNWSAASGGDPAQTFQMGRRFGVRWIDLDAVQAPDGDLRMRGRAQGAAIFARGEGMALAIEDGKAVIYFACTSGGAAKKGQIWRYTPSPEEGSASETASPGMAELFVESAGDQHFDHADNIVASPIGDLIVCEDGSGDEFVRAVTPAGLVYKIARNAHSRQSEFAGACFSPDGSTMFVNIQTPGVTLAITGDWKALRRQAEQAV